jgi:hypothetical protein
MSALNSTQIAQIKEDLGTDKEFLTDEEVLAIAENVKAKIPFKIPFLSDQTVLTILFKNVRKIDRELYKLLPNEYYELVRNLSDGISSDEAKELIRRLTPLINKLIDIPILSEAIEAAIIEFVLDQIVNALVKGFKLSDSAIAA